MNLKITNQNIEKCSHTFDDWSFVIDTVQLFCQRAWIWYPKIRLSDALSFSRSGCSRFPFCGIQITSNPYFPPNLPLFSVFSFKMARVRIFSRRTPAKVWSNLKNIWTEVNFESHLKSVEHFLSETLWMISMFLKIENLQKDFFLFWRF